MSQNESMNIIDFLKARIAEDEAQAIKHQRAASASGFGDYPARVLVECAAKRAIITAHQGQVDNDDPGVWIVASKVLLRTLASVYKDHPDYQQEWSV